MRTPTLLILILLSVAAPRTPTATGSTRDCGGIDKPRVVSAQAPHYPRLALAAGVSGTVVVEVVIDSDGVVTSLKAIEGHRVLVEGALAAARRWHFEQAASDVDRSTRLSFVFVALPTASGDGESTVCYNPDRIEVRRKIPPGTVQSDPPSDPPPQVVRSKTHRAHAPPN